MKHIVELHGPNGEFETLNISDGTPCRYVTKTVAERAAIAAIYGNPNAFWESERRAAVATRKARKGWNYTLKAVGNA